jgi:hypothetical protein
MFEAYSVGIRLKLLDGVSTGLVALAGQFQSLNRHVSTTRTGLSDIEKQLAKLKLLGVAGGAMVGVGAFGLSLFRGPLEEAKQFQTEAARFASLGFGDKVNADAVKFATGMKTFGTSARENLTLVSDAMAVFKNLEHSEMAAPIMAKMKFANEAVFGSGGKANESKFMDMLKVIEFRRGLSSPQEFESQANFVQKVISGSRNRVDATQLLQALKTGGVALSQRSNESFYLGSEPLIQEFGGSRYGTAAMSIYQNLVQSRGTITAQQELYRLGLLDKNKVQFNQLGQLKKALPGAFTGSGVLEKEGELALLEKVLLPAFAAKGISGEEAIVREMGMILGNRTGSGLMSRIYQQRETLKMQSEANKSAKDINGLDALGRNTLAGKELELHAKWRDVLKELGTAVLPIAIKAVEGLTVMIKGFIGFAREFPTLTKWLTVGFGVLAGLVAAGGALTLATVGFKALGLALVVGKGAGLGSMLLEAAGGLGVLGKATLALGAIWGAYKVFELGAALYDLHKANNREGVVVNPESKARAIALGFMPPDKVERSAYGAGNQVAVESPYISGRTTAGQPIHTTVNIDGRKVAESVTQHQAKAANRPQTGMTSFDGRQALTPAGATGSW